MSARERWTVGAYIGGWALDAMDVQPYSFAIPSWNAGMPGDLGC